MFQPCVSNLACHMQPEATPVKYVHTIQLQNSLGN